MSTFIAKPCSFGGRGAFTLIAASLLAACGAGGTGYGDYGHGGGDSLAALGVGPAGGSVTSADGRARLDIPAGALDTIRQFKITPVDLQNRKEFDGADFAFDVEPAGVAFLQPVRISVMLAPPRTPVYGLNAKVGAIALFNKGNPEALADQNVTVDGNTNTAWVGGTLPQSAPIAFGGRLQTDTGAESGTVNLSWRGLPEKLTVGVGYRAEFGAVAAGSPGFSGGVRYEAVYKDQSVEPLRHVPDMSLELSNDGFRKLEVPSFVDNTPITFGGYGNYVADSAVDKIDNDVQLKLSNSNLRVDFGGRIIPLPQQRFQFLQSYKSEAAGPPPSPGPKLKYRTVDVRRAAEGMFGFHLANDLEAFLLEAFGLVKFEKYTAFATSNPGLHIVNLTTGETVRSKDLLGMPMFGVVPHMKDGKACLFGYGSTTARTCYFADIGDFGATEVGINVGPVTDAGLLSTTPVNTPAGGRHLLWYVGNGRVTQEIQPGGAGSDVQFRSLDERGAPFGWYRAGGTPTGKPQSAFFNANADLALVVRGEAGAPGQLWFGNPGDPAGGMFVGSLAGGGNDTRKIRCALPVCAVSSFGGLVTVVRWDGVNVPAIVGTLAGTSGAVGIDVTVEGANRTIRSADFNNNTVNKTIVDATGQVISSVTQPLPPECTKPGHVTSQPGANGEFETIVSCNGVNAQDKSVLAILFDSLFFAQ